MTSRLQNLMLAMLLALTTLFVGFGTLSQNPTSGGYQLFERAASGISADIPLAALENFAPPPETASEYAIAPNREVGIPIRQYPDGSFRTPDGKFASQGGLPAPGTRSAQEYTQHLRDNGFNVVGEELTVRGAVGNRRYDAVVRTDKGELWGIEYKSGGATKTPQQNFNDMYINRYGADGVGQLAGERVVGNITIYLP